MSNTFRRPYTITRNSVAGSYNTAGEYVEGATTTLSIMTSIQPADAEDLKSLPEGRRESEAYRLYTDTLLKITERDSTQGDTILIGTKQFEVLSIAPWQNRGTEACNHYKAVCALVLKT